MDQNNSPQPIRNETPSIQPSLQQPINEIPSPKNKSKLILFIIIFLIVVLGVVTYYLTIKQNKQTAGNQSVPGNKSATQSQIAAQNKQGQITPTPDTTSNWKTYENTLYGYEFKYPSEIISYDKSAPLIDPPRISAESMEEVTIREGAFGENQLGFLVINTDKSAREWFDEDSKTYWEKVTAKDVFFAGEIAIEGNGVGGYNFPYRELVVARKGYLMIIRQVVEYQLYDQILSTFKFTD